jgi:hypothetical protein
LFCGTKSIGKSFEKLGCEVISLDNDDHHKPDICKSILDFNPKDDLPKGWKPDIIWASPPCTTFSVMSNFNYWDFLYPKNSKACINQAFVLKTLEIIKELEPKYWFIENPVGLLRKFKFMKCLPRKTVTYCQYGTKYMKPTDIWTNATGWIPRKMCKNGDGCHEEARRESRTGIQGTGGLRQSTGWTKEARVVRAIIPKQLCDEIANFCMGNNKIKQEKIN